MKRLYIIAGFACMLALACKKDNSTGPVHPLPAVVVSGLEDTYSSYTYRDTLRIHPVVEHADLYDFYWTVYSTNFVQATGKVPTPDTIGRAQALDYPTVLEPGQYILVFNIKDKKTGVVNMLTVNMNVVTLNMNGWYLLKDDGGKTDLDFIYPEGRIDNWIAFYNDGKSLEGNAVKAVFTPSFKMTLAATDLFSALTVLSDHDAGIYRIDDGKIKRSFDDMFFSKPAVRHPQNVFQPVNVQNLCLINDNKAYFMSKGALFTDMPSNYKVSPKAAVGIMDIGFDDITKSVILFNGPLFAALPPSGQELQNMHADLLWMTNYPVQRNFGLCLFRMPDNRGVLMKLNTQYSYLSGLSAPIVTNRDTIAATHGLMQASAIGGNYDADYVYYAVGNNVYVTDVASAQENLQATLPAGETVTCIQHIKYPQPQVPAVAPTVDKLAVASFSNGHYKVWLYNISSTGTLDTQAKPAFEGNGRVANVTYMEQGLGSRFF